MLLTPSLWNPQSPPLPTLSRKHSLPLPDYLSSSLCPVKFISTWWWSLQVDVQSFHLYPTPNSAGTAPGTQWPSVKNAEMKCISLSWDKYRAEELKLNGVLKTRLRSTPWRVRPNLLLGQLITFELAAWEKSITGAQYMGTLSCTSLVTCLLIFVSPPSETGYKKIKKDETQNSGQWYQPCLFLPGREEEDEECL